MAPSIYPRVADDAFDTHLEAQPETREATDGEMEPWLIVVIVLGALILVSLFVFLILHLTRRRKRIAREGYQKTPLKQKGHRRGKMSKSDRLAAEEIERATMIRKSLTSRTSSWGAYSSRESGLSEYQMEEFDHEEPEEPEERAPMASRDNWKELEAGSQPIPGVHNTEMGVHPALLPQPQLAFPQPSRGPSPNRGLQPPRLIIPP
ncbi:hypothetical protein F4804DRAFT_316152 [Jackrogersella minutella]|nr:hypothetical protein F4804DRAFT_316152 [Jackrogersella minutella]